METTKKYGFFTALSMVVGIVIGSGIFKSGGDIWIKAGGNTMIAILAWVLGGLIIIASTYSFSFIALRETKSSGLIDYVESAYGLKAGYMVGFFLAYVYLPSLVAIIAWLAGNLTGHLFGLDQYANYFAFAYLIGVYALNFLSPIISGYFQVSATFIKLIPLFLIGVVGMIYGGINPETPSLATSSPFNASNLAVSVAFTAFAYDGWITALSITHELKDAKKNLSKALVFGALLIVIMYVVFFMGITSVISYEEAVPLAGSLNISVLAVSRLFGPFIGSLISYFVLISVLGTLNGLTLASMRGFYQIGVKKVGFKPDLMIKLTKHEAPLTSGIFSIVMSLFWGLIWLLNINGTFNTFIDTSILPIIFLYSFYIIIYVYIMRHYKDLNVFKRFIVTGLSIVGSLYLIYGAYTSSPKGFIYYVLILIGFAGIALYTYKPKALK